MSQPPSALKPLVGTLPAGPDESAKARIAATVETSRAEILGLSHDIHAHPEPAFEEVQAASWVAAL